MSIECEGRRSQSAWPSFDSHHLSICFPTVCGTCKPKRVLLSFAKMLKAHGPERRRMNGAALVTMLFTPDANLHSFLRSWSKKDRWLHNSRSQNLWQFSATLLDLFCVNSAGLGSAHDKSSQMEIRCSTLAILERIFPNGITYNPRLKDRRYSRIFRISISYLKLLLARAKTKIK